MSGDIVNQCRILQSSRVDGDLIRTGIEQAVYICQFVDAATYGEGNIDFRSNPFHQFGEGFPSFMARCDVEVNQFVCSLFAVSLAQLHRVTGLSQVDEVGSFTVCPSLMSRQGMIRLASIVFRFF